LAAQLEQSCSLQAAITANAVANSALQEDDPNELISLHGQRILLIYGQDQPLSNWYFASFVIAGQMFCHVEQFFQWQKAKCFGDFAVAGQVLETTNPCKIRRLGSMIRGFSGEVWKNISEKVHGLKHLSKIIKNNLGNVQRSLCKIYAESGLAELPETDWERSFGLRLHKAR
jgi:ribA/ribD-fused uncharacterized protein